MARFQISITGPNGKEVYNEETERMGVSQFCELLAHDSTRAEPAYPLGSEIVLTDLRNGKVLLRYVVGYE